MTDISFQRLNNVFDLREDRDREKERKRKKRQRHIPRITTLPQVA